MSDLGIITDIARGIDRLVSDGLSAQTDCHGSPLFLLCMGSECGSEAVTKALASSFTLINDGGAGEAVLAPLARQLISVGLADSDSAKSRNVLSSDKRLTHVLHAQARFLADVFADPNRRGAAIGWGCVQHDLPWEYAEYLRLLFPRARFLFLWRNPVAAYRSFLGKHPSARHLGSDRCLAASIAARWCQLMSSFERRRSSAQGALLSYEAFVRGDVAHVERYIGAEFEFPVDEPADVGEMPEIDRNIVEAILQGTQPFAEPVADTPGRGADHLPGGVWRGSATADRPASCVVLVPVARYVELECSASLRELERRGYTVHMLRGCASIDLARSKLATRALDEGYEETLWVDADIAFDPDAVERLREHNVPISCGIYAKKGYPGLAARPLTRATEVVFGADGGLVEILYAGAGFLHVRRLVYEAIRDHLNLPVCDASSSNRALPFFMPMLEKRGMEYQYLAEDYAFSHRARQCGFKVLADTSIRLWHIGSYRYGVEDASEAVERRTSYRHRIVPDPG